MNEVASFCNWYQAKFLVFSGNVFDPIIYYSHIGPFILAIILGLFAFLGNRKSLLNKILIALVVFFCVWAFFDLFLWANEKVEYVMFVWSSMIFFDLLIYATSLYLVYFFINKKDLPLLKKIIIAVTFVPLIVFASTKYNLISFDLTNCDREAPEGILWSYTYITEILFILWLSIEGIIGVVKYRESRVQNSLFLLGVILFLITFSWGNITGMITEDWSIGQYGLFGVPIFVGFLTYLIVKFKIINAKLIGAQALVLTMVFFIGALLLIQDPYRMKIMLWVTLVLSIIFGLALIKSVKNEVKRKEELQEMADKLAVANDQLRKLDNAKSEFISIASHQLRTPLTAIKGFISLILEGSYGEISPPVHEAISKVYVSGERLIQLVEDLLNISRIEAGRMDYRFEKSKVQDVLTELYENFILVAKTKKLFLDLKLPEQPLPEINMDKTKIREVVSNLIDNGLKYSEKGGVTIRADYLKFDPNREEGKTPSTEKGAPLESDVIRVTVSDTGIGIPAEEMPYLFKKFSRGKDTNRLHVGGTGLGIYVGKNIMDAHKGRIWLESEGPGKGSRFIIELPV